MSAFDAAVQGILRGDDSLDGRRAPSARAAEAVALIEKYLGICESLPVPTEWAHKIPADRWDGAVVLPEPEWEPDPSSPRGWRDAVKTWWEAWPR